MDQVQRVECLLITSWFFDDTQVSDCTREMISLIRNHPDLAMEHLPSLLASEDVMGLSSYRCEIDGKEESLLTASFDNLPLLKTIVQMYDPTDKDECDAIVKAVQRQKYDAFKILLENEFFPPSNTLHQIEPDYRNAVERHHLIMLIRQYSGVYIYGHDSPYLDKWFHMLSYNNKTFYAVKHGLSAPFYDPERDGYDIVEDHERARMDYVKVTLCEKYRHWFHELVLTQQLIWRQNTNNKLGKFIGQAPTKIIGFISSFLV